MREKDVVGVVTGVCEETFDINSKNSLNKAKYLKFHCQKVESTRNGKLQRLSRRLSSGDQEKWVKIWSLPDYAGELTALRRKHLAFHDATTVVSLSNDCRNSLLMTCYYPDLGSDASSVWNFCARFSGVILRGNQSGSSAN